MLSRTGFGSYTANKKHSGMMRTACLYRLYMLVLLTPDVRTGGGDHQVNKFEQVPSFGHRMPLTGEKRVGTCTEGPGQGPVQKGVLVRKG